MEIKGTIIGNTPSKSNCYKIITIKKKGKMPYSSLGKTKKLKDYENSFYQQVGKIRGQMIDDLFKFEIDVYYPSARADLDNSLKIVLDCLQKSEVIKNDNKCTDIHARRFIDRNNPRIEFRIILAMKE